MEIKLQKGKWSYDPEKLLGQAGGFGEVFEGYSEEYGPIAIKRLYMSANDAAHRELDIAEVLKERSSEHIIPVLDSGLDAESNFYFLVMALAEKSLQDHIDASETIGDAEAAQILLEIVFALQDVPDLTHRDLKPQNILRHDDKWKVADFGIARFVEESTSAHTLKGFLSHLYAAPEQWNLDRSTAATDVYALGCIAYTLLTGSPPFQGSPEQLKAEHLSGQPPTLDAEVDSRLRSLAMMMLRKSPDARPSLERIAKVLISIAETHSSQVDSAVLQKLSQADAAIQQQQAEKEAKRAQEKRALDQRNYLAEEALKILDGLKETLFKKILENASAATRDGKSALRLGSAQLTVSLPFYPAALDHGVFKQSNWDTITGAKIEVIQKSLTAVSYVWASSLWYAKLPETDDYRWYEVSYFTLSARHSHPHGFEPFDLDATEADLTASPAIHVFQIAFGPSPIDDEDAEDFYRRWVFLLTQATEGKLRRPRSFPLRDDWNI